MRVFLSFGRAVAGVSCRLQEGINVRPVVVGGVLGLSGQRRFCRAAELGKYFDKNQKIAFSGNVLDKLPTERKKHNFVNELWTDSGRVKVLPFFKGVALVDGGAGRLAWRQPEEISPFLDHSVDPVLLGRDHEGVAIFAAPIASLYAQQDATGSEDGATFVRKGEQWADLRLIGDLIPLDETGILAQAISMIGFVSSHRHCMKCGSKLKAVFGGTKCVCTSKDCKASFYPTVKPAVIMLVLNNKTGMALLGRGTRHPPRMMSLLAGFVDIGESVEEAVAREVQEEAGVVVSSVSYVTSQPYPAPAQLMLACVAKTDDEDFCADPSEIHHLKWVSKNEVRKALEYTMKVGGRVWKETHEPQAGATDAGVEGEEAPPFTTPPAMAVAHRLMAKWVAGDLDGI